MDQLSKERLTIRVDEVDSTNLMLKKIAREEHPEEGSVVIAGYQTGGGVDKWVHHGFPRKEKTCCSAS